MRVRQRGFSLLELAVALVVLGGLAGVAFAAAGAVAQRHRIAEAQQALERGEQALVAFAHSRHRLPCPDSDGSGREDCRSGTASGRLPYRALGLPASHGQGELDYEVDAALTRTATNSLHELCRTLLATAKPAPAAVLTAPVGAQGAGRALTRALGSYELTGRLRCGGLLASIEALENEIAAARLTARTLSLSAEWAEVASADATAEPDREPSPAPAAGSGELAAAAATAPAATARRDLLEGYRDEVLKVCAAMHSLVTDAGGAAAPCE